MGAMVKKHLQTYTEIQHKYQNLYIGMITCIT